MLWLIVVAYVLIVGVHNNQQPAVGVYVFIDSLKISPKPRATSQQWTMKDSKYSIENPYLIPHPIDVSHYYYKRPIVYRKPSSTFALHCSLASPQ